MKYRKKPVVIEAIQFNGHNTGELTKWSDGNISLPAATTTSPVLFIHTLEGIMSAGVNDFIIKGVNGEFYPCKPDIFEKTYDKVEEDDLGPMSGLPCTFKDNPPRVEPL